MDKIPVNLDDPRCPREVIHHKVADIILDLYRSNRMDPHPDLEKFLTTFPGAKGYEWEQTVVSDLVERGDVNLAKRWVETGLPQGLFRAELRGWIKEKGA